jgi:hypothetical protein
MGALCLIETYIGYWGGGSLKDHIKSIWIATALFAVITVYQACEKGAFYTATPKESQESQLVVDIDTCPISDLNSAKVCLERMKSGQIKTISFEQNISCSFQNCCQNGAILNLDGMKDINIKGNGRKILRQGNYRSCSAITLRKSSNITISDLTVDEDATKAACSIEEYSASSCPSAVSVSDSHNIIFRNFKLLHAKSYAISVWNTNGFRFENSSLVNSGILGLYIGHWDYGNSSNIAILNSVFEGNVTNAIAIEGVTGTTRRDNLIAGNYFSRNHRLGIWQVEPEYGTGFTGGGQMYLAMVNQLTVENNIISNGYCNNCLNNKVAVGLDSLSGVTGIELAKPSHPFGVRNLTISDNRFINLDSHPIYLNENGFIENSVHIINNFSANNGFSSHFSSIPISNNNSELKTTLFNGFENANDLDGPKNTWNTCASGAEIIRWCPGQPEAHHQNCVLRFATGPKSCNQKQTIAGRGIYQEVQQGKSVYANAWVRNGAAKGEACIVFADNKFQQLSQVCKVITATPGWYYRGIPTLSGIAPQGAAHVSMQFVLEGENSFMDIDSLRISISP